MGRNKFNRVTFFYDGVSSIRLANNIVCPARTKHIEMHYYREKVLYGQSTLERLHCTSWSGAVSLTTIYWDNPKAFDITSTPLQHLMLCPSPINAMCIGSIRSTIFFLHPFLSSKDSAIVSGEYCLSLDPSRSFPRKMLMTIIWWLLLFVFIVHLLL